MDNEHGAFNIVERVVAHIPDSSPMIIIQAVRRDTNDTVWAIGNDRICAVSNQDFVRNKIPYSSIRVHEFPYEDNSPESVGEWRPLIEELVGATAQAYMKRDGLFHIYPQWLPEASYAHLGKDLFEQMSADCDHIILWGNGDMESGDFGMMDFVPKREAAAEKESVVEKIRQSKDAVQPDKQQRPKAKKQDRHDPAL